MCLYGRQKSDYAAGKSVPSEINRYKGRKSCGIIMFLNFFKAYEETKKCMQWRANHTNKNT